MVALSLEAHGVGVAFSTSSPVLREVDLHLSPGWYGLVGANGAGKTTLLRVLAGELVPTDGVVRIAPRDATVVVCEQTVDHPSDEIVRFASSFEGHASSLRGRLGLDDTQPARWSSLSAGERKRWQIGAALALGPDVLLLDEPTNHLDARARELLVSALRRFNGIGVVVSHDRALLGELPTAILRVSNGLVGLHPGAYEEAEGSWKLAQRALEDAHASAKERVRTLEARLVQARTVHASAERARSSGARMKSPRDHDARGGLAKGRVESAAARAGMNVGVARAELERASNEVPFFERDRTIGRSVFAQYERAASQTLFHLDREAIYAGDREVLSGVRLTIGREERVRIAGPNGAGKTTLLHALLDSLRPEVRERILHLPQELTPTEVTRLITELRALAFDLRGRVLSLFAALGSDPARLLGRSDAELSPGESKKLALALALALGLGREVWALVLDEPENHLDLASIERLELLLEAYPGAIVLVSHDDSFADGCTSRVVSISNGSIS